MTDEERRAIEWDCARLINLYATLNDQGRWEEVAALYAEDGLVEISPAPLNQGERRFVEDLKAFHDGDPAFFAGKELYLLRNLSRGRGVGFFEAGNFHPDFIVWLLVGDKQFVTFVDPKGIRQLASTDPKVEFFKTIKEIERAMARTRRTALPVKSPKADRRGMR